MGSLVLSYIAGVMTLLSPCVLPLLPIILFGALQQHRYGSLALASGLVTSFTLVGFLLALVGHSIGLDDRALQTGAGFLLLAVGVVLLFQPLYQRFSAGASRLTTGLNSKATAFQFNGLLGQFGLGAILGLVWSPCVGPTLGAAISLAAQGQNLILAFMTMLIFAIGTVTPLLLFSLLPPKKMYTAKNKLARANHVIKPIMSMIFILVGLSFITGWIFTFEEILLDALPIQYIQFLVQF